MRIDYRQGILTKSTLPEMLYGRNGVVNLRATTTPVLLAFTYGKRNYLHTIDADVESAWVVPQNGTTMWLYWELDQMTGMLSYGMTSINPLGYGETLPLSPDIGTHFFDHNDMKMKVWTGGSWAEKIRLIAARVKDGIIQEQGFYSQAGLFRPNRGGHIVYDRFNNPVFSYDDDVKRTKYFSVVGDVVESVYSNTHKTALDKLQLGEYAGESVGKNKCLIVGDDGLVYMGSRDTDKPIIGVSARSYNIGDKVKMLTDGFIVNRKDWNWVEPENTNLFVDDVGSFTSKLVNDISSQIIATVVSPNTIFINIQEKITVLQGIGRLPTPTPSPTPDVTPDVTPSPTVTPTSDVTPTPTLTPVYTEPVTPTVTPTSDVTPTPTLTPTMSITPTQLPPLTANLVSWWSMDEGTGLTRADSHTTNNLPDTTTTTQVVGKVATAAGFTTNHLSIPIAGTGIDGGGSFSIAGWIYFDSLATESKYIVCRCKETLASNADIDWQLIHSITSNRLTFVTNNGASFYYANADTFGAPVIDTWYFVFGYHDAVNGINGISINAGPIDFTTGIPLMNSGGDTFNVGWLGAVAPRYMTGRVDELTYWNTILTDREVNRLYNGGVGLSYPI